jgi:hypothetical protein
MRYYLLKDSVINIDVDSLPFGLEEWAEFPVTTA